MFRPIAAALLAALAAAPLSAAELRVGDALAAALPPGGSARTVGEITALLRGGVRAQVISAESSATAFVIPIAGNAAGGNGTFFRSDVSLANRRPLAQRIAVGWLQAGVDNSSAPLSYYDLEANTIQFVDDFVGAQLKKSGLGAILVVGVDAGGNLDDDADLDGFSRIWTPQPGSDGTVSQNFPAVDVHDSLGTLPAYVLGLKQDGRYRSNVGIVNLDGAAHDWTVRSIVTGNQVSVTVPANSVVQLGIAAGSARGDGNVALNVSTTASGAWWSAYGTSVDNVTGDGWVARATQ